MDPPRKAAPTSKAAFNATVCSQRTYSSNHAADVSVFTLGSALENTFLKKPVGDRSKIINEYELDFNYNSYLQSLMVKEIAEESIRDKCALMARQIEHHEGKLRRSEEKQSILKRQVQLLAEKGEIIESLKTLEKNMKELKISYDENNICSQMERITKVLKSECEKVALKNVKKLNSEQEYEKLVSVLKELLVNSRKIINSGRDFQSMHLIAEKIRSYKQKKDSLLEQHKDAYELQKNSIYELLQNTSDLIASEWNNI